MNGRLVELDERLARRVRDGQVQGLVCVSCDVALHAATLRAAGERQIPVTGSGGTSLAAAQAGYGVRLVGNAGGSVATTSYTRAVSYSHALATAWGKGYEPGNGQELPNCGSILCACLPCFWAVAVMCRALDFVPRARHVQQLLRQHALPTVCSVIMASSLAPQHGPTVLMSAALASVVCEASILAGLLAGWLVARLAGPLLFRCILWDVPATMTNLIVAGGLGVAVAILLAPGVQYLNLLSATVREAIHLLMSGRIPGLGAAVGVLFCWGSKYGYYHAISLPLILLEMEMGYGALLGAIDEATLVCISAGICLANLMLPPTLPDQKQEEILALSRRGLRINLLFGDFIEVGGLVFELRLCSEARNSLASCLQPG